jgi:hypothetical protein
MGGIETVITALTAHRRSQDVHQFGFLALSNLVANNDTNQARFMAKGGLETGVAAMNAHRSSEFVQCYGCMFLTNLAFSAANKVSIAAAGGIEAVVAAMNAHRNSENVQRVGCSALSNITATDAQVQRKAKTTPGLTDALAFAKCRFPPLADDIGRLLARLSSV